MYEQYDEQYFLQKAKSMGEELGVDTRTGSIYMDAAAGHAIRTAWFFSDMDDLLDMMSLDTCYGDALDDKAAEHGLTRHAATPSVWIATLTPAEDEDENPLPLDLEEGAEFFSEDSEFYFTLHIDNSGLTPVYYLTAEEAGTETNTIPTETSIVPVDDIDNLEEAELTTLVTPGTDEEDDDTFRERLREKLSGGAENGNKQDYKSWCESVDGVGRAQILPLWGGENTVRAILYGTNGGAPAPEVVAAVQNLVDPITDGWQVTVGGVTYTMSDGLGDGVANLGCHFLASAVTELDIDVSVTVTLAGDYTVQTAKAQIEEAVRKYLEQLALDGTDGTQSVVRINSIGALIEGLASVVDYANLKINNGTSNITVPIDKVAVLGEVTVNVST